MFVACGDTTDVLTKGHEEQTGNKTINQYVVLDDIGSGASGKVKLAFCLARKTTVAIKVVRWQAKVEGPALGRRGVVFDDALRREIAIMKKLVHPNVVQLYEVIDDPSAEKLYLVMKYADGGTVAKLRPDGSCDTLPLQRVQSIAVQVCSGLQYLHECGVVHCDIKPDNLLATSGLRTMIADFGVSRLVHSGAHSGSVAGKCSGTPLFMAPELHRGYLNRPVCLPQSPVDSDTAVVGSRDMWALGVTLFCLLWGRLPFATMDEITNPMADVPLPHGVVPCSDATCTSVRLQWLSVLQLLFHRDPQCRPTAKRFRKASKCLKDACPGCLASRWGSGPPVPLEPQEGPSPCATSAPPPFALAVCTTSMDNPLDPSGSFSPHFCCQLPSSHCLNSPQPNASTRNANGWRQRLTVSEREVSEAIGVRRSDS